MKKTLKDIEETARKLADAAEQDLKDLKELLKKDEEEKELK